ncbi:S-protein homolog 4-like [Morus notabilis]|uniref:S-protein homolog 4-like n=1 Tax=Morus notabilis TaxID=981085 RepID=UPI000CED7672|nr:S-protein homolog 4-like [Morus notabilis]
MGGLVILPFSRNVILLMTLLSVAICTSEGVKTHVHMTNDLGTGTDLTVHCKSKDDDLGIHVVAPNGSYGFRFAPNIFGGTLFFCRMEWPGNSHYFDIYVQKRDRQLALDEGLKLQYNLNKGEELANSIAARVIVKNNTVKGYDEGD